MKKFVQIAAGVLIAGAAASVGLACCGADGALDFMKYYAAIGTIGAAAVGCLAAFVSRMVRRSPALIALHLGLALVLGGWVYNELAGPRGGDLYLCPGQAGRVAEKEDAPPTEGFVLEVKDFTIDYWNDTGTVRQYVCKASVERTDADGTTFAEPTTISVNHPLVKDGWWVYQSSYGQMTNPHTGELVFLPSGEPRYYTVLQCVKDIGLPYVALGGLLLVLGAFLYQFRLLAVTRHLVPAAGEPCSRATRLVLVLYGLLLAGTVSMLVHRALVTGHPPLQNMYEFLMCAAVFIPLRTFCGLRRSSERDRVRTLLVDAALETLVLMPVCFFMDGRVKHLMPALQSPFFIPHVGAYVIGYIFLVRAALGVGVRTVATGFFLLTLGLVLGAAWGKVCWGHWWQFDPKEMWSLATWLVYAAYFHLRPRLSARAERAFLIAGAVMVVLTLTWINLSRLFTGMHSYA